MNHYVPTQYFYHSSRFVTPLVTFAGIMLFACYAHAQDSNDGSVSDTMSSLTLTPSNVAINLESCSELAESEEFSLTGIYNNPSITVNYHVRLIATTGSSCSHEDVCNETPLDDGGCSCLKELSNSSTISTSFTVAELFDEVCVEGQEKTISFFLHYTETESDPLIGLNPIEEESQALKLSVDLNPPSAPDEAPTVTPAEEALVINAPEVGGDVVKYQACVWAVNDSSREEARCKQVTGGSGERFEGLENDVLYNVVYVVYDDAENRSKDSPTAQGTPASVLDFAEVYSQEYRGGERGGCDAGSAQAQPWYLLLLLAFVIGLRQSFRLQSMCSTQKRSLFLLISFLFTSTLQLDTVFAQVKKEPNAKSTVQFSGGAYQPSIDDEFMPREGVQRPYERVFQNQSPLMFQVQMERHLIENKGTLSLGGSLGYWNVEGEGLSVTTIAESTKLSILPFSLYGSYRLDFFQESFPVVPVLKVGISYYSWTIYDGAGETARFVDGSEASGGTLGWFYSLGAHFLLDFLDKEMAWAFERDAGVSHSYLTFEYQSSQVDDFGDPDSFRLGNDVYFFGIALDL